MFDLLKLENLLTPRMTPEYCEQLSRINEQLAVRNRRGRFILRLVLGILAAIVVFNILLMVFSYGAFRSFQDPVQTVTSANEALQGDTFP